MDILIPQSLLFDGGLPANLTHTWLQLRSLAGETGRTPLLSPEGLARRTGKSIATLYRHLRRLKEAGLLDWSSPGRGLHVSFAEVSGSRLPAEAPAEAQAGPGVQPAGPESSFEPLACAPAEAHAGPPQGGFSILSGDSQNCVRASLNTLTDSLINLTHVEGVSQNREFRSKSRTGSKTRLAANSGNSSPNALSKPASERPTTSAAADAVGIYRQLARLTPNPTQRELLRQQVDDLPRWRQTLEHWLAHRWNPRNLPGMLDLYRRGGASACRYCPETEAPKAADAFEQLRAKYRSQAVAAAGPAIAVPLGLAG